MLSHSVVSDSFMTPRTVVHEAPLSMEFSRQGCWIRLPFPPPEDLPDPGIKPMSTALQADSLALSHRGIIFYCLVTQLCPTLCDPVDCSQPGFSVHGILQARILEWGVISYFRGSSQSRDQTHVSFISCIGSRVLYL